MIMAYESIVSVAKPSGTAVVLQIACRHRAFVKKLVVVRLTGGSGDVTVELFSKNPTSIAAVEQEPLYRIMPSAATSSGVSEQYFDHGRIAFCHDAADTNNTVPGFAYLRLSGAGTGTWMATLGSYTGV